MQSASPSPPTDEQQPLPASLQKPSGPSPGGSQHQTPSFSSGQQPLNRACESCRVLKVRCLAQEANPSAPCQRCSRTGRACIFAPPQRRKPRKRTDARVAELEKEVKAMRLMLAESRAQNAANGKKGGGQAPPAAEQKKTKKAGLSEKITDFNDVRRPGSAEATDTPRTTQSEDRVSFQISLGGQYRVPQDSQPWGRPGDIVERGLITMEIADDLFELYRKDLNDQYPGVSIPQDATAQHMRETKPVLWLAIIAATVMSVDPPLAAILNDELIRTLADHVFIKGEKSMELVEALLVTVIYHYPPLASNRLLLFQYSHLATGMVVELGLGSKPASMEESTNPAKDNILDGDVPEDLLDRARTLLASYLFTAGLSMRLRRPSFLQFNNWMGECLDLLSHSSDIINRRTAAWVKLHRITEETAQYIGLDDASTKVELSDSRLTAALKNFERRMEDWLRTTEPELLQMFILVDYYFNFVTIYEFAMDGGKHDAGEFKRKHFTLPSLDNDAALTEDSRDLTSIQIDTTIKCVAAVQKLLNEVLKADTRRLRTASNVIFVRVLYSVVFLLRISMQATTSSLGDYLEPESIRAEYYLDAFEKKISDAAGSQGFRVPSHWLANLTSKGKPWLKKFKERVSAQNSPVNEGAPSEMSVRGISAGGPKRSGQNSNHDMRTTGQSSSIPPPSNGPTPSHPTNPQAGFDYNPAFQTPMTRVQWPYPVEGIMGSSTDPAADFFHGGMVSATMPPGQFDFPMNGAAQEFLGFNTMNGAFEQWPPNNNDEFSGHFM